MTTAMKRWPMKLGRYGEINELRKTMPTLMEEMEQEIDKAIYHYRKHEETEALGLVISVLGRLVWWLDKQEQKREREKASATPHAPQG